MRSLVYTLIAGAAILTTASCNNKEENNRQKTTSPVEVVTNVVTATGRENRLEVGGTIHAVNSTDLSTRMMGYVERINVTVGDQVKKGQLLLTVNDTDIRAKKARVEAGIREAEAAYSNAEKDFKRYQTLFEEESVSAKEMDDMTSHFEMAKARLQAAKEMIKEVNAQMSYSRIKAPFSGIITAKHVKEGDMATPGHPLLSLEGPGQFEIIAPVPESEIAAIDKEQPVTVRVKAVNTELTATLSELSTSARNTAGQYLAKVLLNNPDSSIRSGMYATVKFSLNTGDATGILIPKKALISQGELKGVFTVSQSNTALLRWLRLGKEHGDQVEVLSGIAPGEHYIIPGEQKLYNGMEVINKKTRP